MTSTSGGGMKRRSAPEKDQPDWVCRDCGGQWGLWWDNGSYSGPPVYCSTFHYGECDVCHSKAGVTEARDYGYLKQGWQLYSQHLHLESSNKPSNEGLPQTEVQGQTF